MYWFLSSCKSIIMWTWTNFRFWCSIDFK